MTQSHCLVIHTTLRKRMCMVINTIRLPHIVRLQAIEAERCCTDVWVARDGTREATCENNHILLLCTVIASHKVAILASVIAGSDNKLSVCYFFKIMLQKVDALFPGRKWLVQYVTSNGAPF